MEGIRVIIVFTIMILMLRKKMNTGLVMFSGALLFGVFYMMSPGSIIEVSIDSLVERSTIRLISILLLITGLEFALRTTGLIQKMIRSLRGIIDDSRVVMAFLPALLGLLPSPGGARFSAPMVGEVASQIKSLDSNEKSLINYWFRHIWEYIFPLYPGLLLASELLDTNIAELSIHNLPFTIIAVLVGFVFCFRNLKEKEIKLSYVGSRENLWKNFWLGLMPIIAIIILVVVLKFDIVVSLASVVVFIILWKNLRIKDLKQMVKESFLFNMIFLVFGVIFFKNMMECSGAFDEVISTIDGMGIPVWLIVASLPFLIGVLTGMVLPMVSISFPIIIGFIKVGSIIHWGLFSLAFSYGFAGVMLSPLHLCLLLTIDHFKADFTTTFKLLILPELLVMLSGLGVYAIYTYFNI